MGAGGTYVPVATIPSSELGKATSANKPLPHPPFFQRRVRVLSRPIHYCIPSKRFPEWLLLAGWRAIVSAGIALSLVSLLANTILLGWGRNQPVDSFTGYPMLFNGSCS